MKNGPTPVFSQRKKFMFYDSERRQADLRIKLKNDNMNQSQFFRAMISGYLENDARVLEYLDSYKDKFSLQGKEHRDTNKRQIKQGEIVKKQFGLDDNDIENFFDIMEEEHPDL